MNGFQPFTLAHAGCLVAWVLFTVVLVLIGRRALERGSDESLRRVLGWGGILFSVAHQAWWMLPPWGHWLNLPFHLCDFNGFVAPLALLTQRRPLRALLYFWSFGLSLQGLVQPTLTTGPATMHFWWFWISHDMILGYAIYDLVVGGFRPAWRDLRTTLLVTNVYFFVMAAFDAATGMNYGFLGPTKPENPTLIDVLGPWPWRLAAIYAIALVVFIVLWLPWAIAGRKSHAALRPVGPES